MNDRLLTVEESVKAYNAGYAKDVAANLLTEEMSKRTANGKRAMLEAQRSIDIEHRNWAIADMRKQSQARIKTLIEEIQVKVMDKEGTRRAGMNWDIIKATHCKANPTSEVEGNDQIAPPMKIAGEITDGTPPK